MGSASKTIFTVVGVVIGLGILILGVAYLLNPSTPNGNDGTNGTVTATPSATGSGTSGTTETPGTTGTSGTTGTPGTTGAPATTATPATPTTGVTVAVTTTPVVVAEVTPPSDWKPIDNTVQKYIAYRPNGWYFRFFSNMELLGIDTNIIPVASEYAGIINITRLTASNNFESYKANLEPGYTQEVQVISGRSWTIIKGKTKPSEIFDVMFAKYAYVSEGGKEFLARIEHTTSNFAGQEGNFDIFVKTIKFY